MEGQQILKKTNTDSSCARGTCVPALILEDILGIISKPTHHCPYAVGLYHCVLINHPDTYLPKIILHLFFS